MLWSGLASLLPPLQPPQTRAGASSVLAPPHRERGDVGSSLTGRTAGSNTTYQQSSTSLTLVCSCAQSQLTVMFSSR